VVFASLVGYYFLTKGKSLPLYKKDRSTTVDPKTKGMSVLIRVLLIAWPVIIGLSRILVGVHWPSDVAGSMILSVAIISLGKLVFFYNSKGGKKKEGNK
jgi:membrane-associated phospholipid phosphatase